MTLFMEETPLNSMVVVDSQSTFTEMKATTECGEAERSNLSTCGVAKEMTPFLVDSATRIRSSTETKETT